MDQPSKKRKHHSTEEKKSKRTKTSNNSNRGTTIRDMFARLDVESSMKKQQNKQVDGFSSKRCTKWFIQYAGSETTIDPEGMEKFCEDICVEPENILMLVIAFQLNAKQMGYFTYEEWKKGMTKLQCDSPDKVKQRLEYFRSLLKDPVEFKKIYRYAFDFIKEKDQRYVDIETSKSMLKLLLGGQWALFLMFHQFLEESNCKVLNRDQWNNILEFSRTVKPDLNNYDADGAWPVIIDDFVEWYKENKNAAS